ncbi:MAG: ribosome biogenesis GTPase A [Halioglobus sp.]|jgi:ribosome biogenesis GTPase A
MAINWYPGHMHKANKDMKEVLPQVDLIIELLDCRLPYSSQNPSLLKLGEGKPCIKIFSKSDLADPEITETWQAHFEQEAATKTMLTTLEQSDKAQKLTQLCYKLVPRKSKSQPNIMAMIAGIPNVGKSTLINAVAGRAVAKTGNEPAITKGLQKIRMADDLVFLDTPGVLWPKIHNDNSGYRLAASGAIKDTAIEIEDIAFYLAAFLINQYSDLLAQRFQLDSMPKTEIEFLEVLGAQRGCLRAGGRVDLEKVSSIFVNEYRSGKLGRITLETPSMVLAEEKIVEQKRLEKEQREALRKQKKHGSRSKPPKDG